MTFYAHISEDGRSQTVEEHLKSTGDMCAKFAGEFDAAEQGYLIGSSHDIGKCSEAFQMRLKGGHIVDHASAGSLECAKLNALWASCCIAGHHGGLPDVGNVRNDMAGDATLFGRLKNALNKNIPDYHIFTPLVPVKNPKGYGKDNLTDSFIIRMLYSCLVDADYLDTERFMLNIPLNRNVCGAMEELRNKLNRYIEPWWSPSNELNKSRCDILRTCIDQGNGDKGLYTLTVPTGGGKTMG